MHALVELGLNNALMALWFAVPAAIVSRWCRRPAVAHALWLLVLLKLVTPGLVPVSIPRPVVFAAPAGSEEHVAPAEGLPAVSSFLPEVDKAAIDQTSDEPQGAIALTLPDGRGSSSASECAIVESIAAIPDPEMTVSAGSHPPPLGAESLVALWLAGSFLAFAWTSLQVYRFRRLLRYAKRAPEDVQRRTRQLARRMQLRHCPIVWLLPGVVSPMLWAVGRRPRLLFPAELLARLDDKQQAAILAHELAHLRRRDHWVRLVEMVALGLYWWHPVAWWARHQLREAEEQCCDAWVVWTLAGAGRAYALALIRTVDFFSQVRPALPMGASGIGRVTQLRRRLTMIMQGTIPRSLSWAGCLAVCGLGLLLLVRLPIEAQQPPSTPPAVGESGSRDEQIESLRRAIQVLEQQKEADLKVREAALRVNQAEVEKVRAEVKEIAKQMADERSELARTEARYRKALAQLAKLEGAGSGSGSGSNRRNAVWNMAPSNLKPGPYAPMQGLSGAAMSGMGDPRAIELGQKLDRLQKALDELRSELHGQRQGPGGGVMAPPAADANTINNEAWYVAVSSKTTPADAQQALEKAQKACAATNHKNGYFLDTLAAALARLGRFEEAVKVQRQALATGELGSLTEGAQQRLQLYEANKPYSEN
jgi:beta-lactamase regulating signal transducer with metallopeptidase domain/tetratricopeptide (TPR) repeat protein